MQRLIVWIIFTIFVSTALSSNSIPDKVCIGTNNQLSVPEVQSNHYIDLKKRYLNCTHVYGNLEITWVKNKEFDFNFLQNIREVSGYVLISHVDVPVVCLPKLQIIRGQTLFKSVDHNQFFALFVDSNQILNLQMSALREIIKGSVGFYNNNNLCHIKTINWDEIMSGERSVYFFIGKFSSAELVCPKCDKSCKRGCWGEGPENCQHFSKVTCSSYCKHGRCFGPRWHNCCHPNCIGGCTGPKPSDCVACRGGKVDEECVSYCPSGRIYNIAGKCVDSCPPNYFVYMDYDQFCLSSCPPGKIVYPGTVKSPGLCSDRFGPYPCKVQPNSIEINSNNIHSFKGCQLIEGSLKISSKTFEGYQQIGTNFSTEQSIKPMHPDKLEIFSTVEKITGYLHVEADHSDFKNLSYFRNLKMIRGESLTKNSSSLYTVNSSLTSLGLVSLKRIMTGAVTILGNKNLCYSSTFDWRIIKSYLSWKNDFHFSQVPDDVMVRDIPSSVVGGIILSDNKDPTDCIKQGLVCDEECFSEKSCMGPDPDQCSRCKNALMDGICVKNCNGSRVYEVEPSQCKICPEKNYYFEEDTRRCGPCDPQCQGCFGPGPDNCIECRNVKLVKNINDVKNNSATFSCIDDPSTAKVHEDIGSYIVDDFDGWSKKAISEL